MDDKKLIGSKNGMAVFVSDTLIAQKGEHEVREQLGLIRRWPVKTDLSGNVAMVEGDSHEDAVQRYLSRTIKAPNARLSGPATAGPPEPTVRRLLARTVVADPPWWPSLHRNTAGRREGPYRAGPQRYYPLLTVEQIEAMAPETAPKAHLWLWTLNQHLDWGVRVARAWGFEPQQTLTWCKPGYGTGQFQCNSEQVLLCRKGGPAGNAFGKTFGTWFEWPRGRHSEKPQAFYDLVERVSPGPYHEMFARKPREGWTCMGNEVTGVLVTPNAK